MLEPWTPDRLRLGRFRSLATRQGFDLEPALSDPSPAFLDPEGVIHPELCHTLSAAPLASFPTPASRSALVAAVLTESGRVHPEDEACPFVRVYKFAVDTHMEPEVTGVLALVLLRGVLDTAQRTHRPRGLDPSETISNPEVDPWQRQRARLSETSWETLWEEIDAAAQSCGEDEALAFERSILRSSHAWLVAYRAWAKLTAAVGSPEELQQDRTAQIEARLDAVYTALAIALDSLDVPQPNLMGGAREVLANCLPAQLLERVIQWGTEAERNFMDRAGVQPEGIVTSRWLLNHQIRYLRKLNITSRQDSLYLHQALRRSDAARVLAQIAYRSALIDLWRRDLDGEDPREMEAALLAVLPPVHRTTMGGGLGRVWGHIVMRQLRREEGAEAEALATRALDLAPEELAVRMLWNDLRYSRGLDEGAALVGRAPASWGEDLLRSLRKEHDHWESLSVSLMGAHVAESLGDSSRVRWFRRGLREGGLSTGATVGWSLAVVETLGHPDLKSQRKALQVLLDCCPDLPIMPGPLTWLLFRSEDPKVLAAAFLGLQDSLTDALADLDEADGLVHSPLESSGKSRQVAAWNQLVSKKLLGPDREGFASALWARIQGLRAAAPELRRAPLAGSLRRLQTLLSRAADVESAASAPDARPPEVPRSPSETPPGPSTKGAVEGMRLTLEDLGPLLPRLAGYLKKPTEDGASNLAAWIDTASDPLRVAVRRPRVEELRRELDRLDNRLRISAGRGVGATISAIRVELAATAAADDIGYVS